MDLGEQVHHFFLSVEANPLTKALSHTTHGIISEGYPLQTCSSTFLLGCQRARATRKPDGVIRWFCRSSTIISSSNSFFGFAKQIRQRFRARSPNL